MNNIVFKSIKLFLEVNFYISVFVLLAGCLLSVSDSYSLFQFNEDLYGALDNNLRIIMIYLAMTETMILIYCFFRHNFQVMIPVGFFLMMMIASMKIYGETNAVEIDENFSLFFLYTGLSHLLYGVAVRIEKNSEDKQKQNHH